jgi:tetratricopeptide (TPR) repeat protein
MLLKSIAEELGVNTIVEGSVTLSGDSLKLLVQLIDVFPEESHLLSKEYSNDLQHILKMQSTAARDIVKNIRVNLSEEEEYLLMKSRTVNPEIYQDYLRGLYFLNQGTPESFETGLNFMRNAIKKDPGDPYAYAGLAMAYAVKGHGMIAPAKSFRSAEAAAERALRIDSTLDEAYTALALIYLYQYWDWTKARIAFENSLIYNPNNAMAHAHFAFYHFLNGDREKTLYHSEIATVLEPLSASYKSWLAIFYDYYGFHDKAENMARKALELKEDLPYGIITMGLKYIRNNQFEKAIEMQKRLPLYGDYYKLFLCYAYVKAGKRDQALAIWNDWEDHADEKWVNPFHRGMVAAMLGFDDRAFELINEAIDNKYYPSNYVELFPSVEYIRDDPRYIALLQKLNLPYRQLLASRFNGSGK